MELVAASIWAFLIAYISIRIAKPIAYKTGLVDQPNKRKHHTGAVPLVGGIAIFIGVMTSIEIFYPEDGVMDLYLISSASILLLGVLDDKHDLKVSYRITVQSISACILIFGAGYYIESLGSIVGNFDLKLGYLGIAVTIVAVIGAINAFNMVDGIDGLAGMLSIVSFLGLSILFASAGSDLVYLPLLFISAIIAYLIFNLGWPIKKLKKIFMGDAGSMLIGLTVVWLLVIGSHPSNSFFKPVTALWIVSLPLMDMTAIMIRRLKKGQSPFKPDRDHLHHICMRAGLSQVQALIFITVVALIMVLFGVAGNYFNFPDWFMFASFLAVFSIYNTAIQNIWKVVKWVRKTS